MHTYPYIICSVSALCRIESTHPPAAVTATNNIVATVFAGRFTTYTTYEHTHAHETLRRNATPRHATQRSATLPVAKIVRACICSHNISKLLSARIVRANADTRAAVRSTQEPRSLERVIAYPRVSGLDGEG